MAPKRPLDASAEHSGRDKKRQKLNNARKIQTGSSVASAAPPPLKQLPVSLDVSKFADARAFEINAMQKTMQSVKSAATTRAWQSLPRHLRRRAASHNVRRVPVRLREKARQEMDPVKKKRLQNFIAKAGKHKRKTRTETLILRQRDKRWLETHIWHAKRMKMQNLWGYRLALHPTEKSFRPSHRASVNGCILHDSSYTSVIELKGELNILKQALARICNPQGLSSTAARFSNGSRACKTELFDNDAYPLGFITPAQIIWQSPTSKAGDETDELGSKSQPSQNQSNSRLVWLGFHPAAYERVSKALTGAVTTVLNHQRARGRPSVEVEIADLRGHFNSFELVGPKSSQVIKGALSLIKADNNAAKKQFWNSLQHLRSPGSCPRGMVVGLKVNDPRLNFPPKNASIFEDISNAKGFTIQPNSNLAESDLWSEKTRLGLSKPTFKKKDLDERRAKQLVPGTALAPLRQDDRIPLILIQTSLEAPNSTSTDVRKATGHTMHGWTIIAPVGWGMPFLTSLIHTGTRVGGLREVKSQATECGLPYFPDDFSGTDLGKESQESAGQVAKAKWDRTPPAKRASFEALGTRSPFEPDWVVVCGFGYTPTHEEGFESTQRMNIDQAKVWLLHGVDTTTTVMELISSDNPAEWLLAQINTTREDRSLQKLDTNALDLYQGALVLVKVTMCDRGTPTDMSSIYDVLPEEYLANNGMTGQEAIDDHIVGYITSGRQSMSLGKGLGIGAIALSKLVTSAQRHRKSKVTRPHMFKLREAHGEIYRYAIAEVI